jgi:hypothetical protein
MVTLFNKKREERGGRKMKQIVKTSGQKIINNRIGVLRLELDYELATLYEAMQNKDAKKKTECKLKLEKLRKEWMKLQA